MLVVPREYGQRRISNHVESSECGTSSRSQENTVSAGKGPAEWIIKETDLPGVYGCAVSLLTFTFNKTRLVADPSDALTYTCTLKEVEIRRVTVLNVFCH